MVVARLTIVDYGYPISFWDSYPEILIYYEVGFIRDKPFAPYTYIILRGSLTYTTTSLTFS